MYICDVMNTKKYTYLDGDFHYEDSETCVVHGLTNMYNSVILRKIGYYYQGKRKCFWLKIRKEY
jgi:hypothetical protein